jgi:hypothetical protein
MVRVRARQWSYGREVMARRWRLIVQVALAGVLAVLAFPADGAALDAVFISLTPTGPSPAVMTIPAGMYPVWINQDTVAHTVVFANGLCSIQVVPGEYDGQCTNGFSPGSYVGDYAYTVDNTFQGSIVTVAGTRSVSLTARRHSIRRGSELRLHGGLHDWDLSPPGPGSPQPIIVLARHDRYHPFRRLAVVTAKLHQTPKSHIHPWGKLVWQIRVRPRTRMIYIAEANSQPSGGQAWQRAWSKPFKVLISH